MMAKRISNVNNSISILFGRNADLQSIHCCTARYAVIKRNFFPSIYKKWIRYNILCSRDNNKSVAVDDVVLSLRHFFT